MTVDEATKDLCCSYRIRIFRDESCVFDGTVGELQEQLSTLGQEKVIGERIRLTEQHYIINI